MKQLSAATMRSVLGPLADDRALFDTSELDRLISAIMQHGRRCIRPRPGLVLDELPFETEPVAWSDRGRFLLDGRVRPGGSLHYVAGDYAIQDAGSLLPLTLMQLEPGQTVCDVCAAPGGKSLAIVEELGGHGLLLSNEVIASRVDTLQLTLARSGLTNYVVTNQPAERLADVAAEPFDCVLVDAPCTGQSMVARGKQSLSAFSDNQIVHSAARQQSILRAAVRLVRPGGRLVYSTCTFAFLENEAIVAWLQQGLPAWEPIVLDRLSDWQTPGFRGCYRLWPHRDHCAGGFAAALMRPHHDTTNMATVLREEQSDGTEVISGARSNDRHHRVVAPRSAKSWSPWQQSTLMDEWGRLASSQPLWQHKHRAHWFSAEVPAPWRELAHAGIEVAATFGEHWQPSYPLATLDSTKSNWFEPHRRIELNDAEAIQFMSGTSLHRPGESGWCVAHWRGRPLGWGKQVGTQLKNHLPKPLRQVALR